MNTVRTSPSSQGIRIYEATSIDTVTVRDVDVLIPGRYRFERVTDIRKWTATHPAGCLIELDGVTIGMEPANFFSASSHSSSG